MERFATLASSVLSATGMTLTPRETGERARTLKERVDAVAQRVASRPTQIPQEPAKTNHALGVAMQQAEWAQLGGIPAQELLSRTKAARAVEAELSAAISTVRNILRDGEVEFTGRVDEVERLLAGGGLHEVLPGVQATGTPLNELRRLAASGWGEWTSGQLTSTAQGIGESLEAARHAQEELSSFFSRLGLPVTTSRAGLEAIGALLKVAEDAPRELLALRGPGLERTDIADFAIKAEETYTSLVAKTA